MEDHILDLDKRLWAVTRYGLVAAGTWVKIDGRWRPCMAITRASGAPRPCVIPLEDAWRWSDTIGSPAEPAAKMLLKLGIDPFNPSNVFKLINLVNDRMADLIAMPPRPPDAEEHAEPVADLTLRDEFNGTTEVSV